MSFVEALIVSKAILRTESRLGSVVQMYVQNAQLAKFRVYPMTHHQVESKSHCGKAFVIAHLPDVEYRFY